MILQHATDFLGTLFLAESACPGLAAGIRRWLVPVSEPQGCRNHTSFCPHGTFSLLFI